MTGMKTDLATIGSAFECLSGRWSILLPNGRVEHCADYGEDDRAEKSKGGRNAFNADAQPQSFHFPPQVVSKCHSKNGQHNEFNDEF
jgi:hypothetical protein